MLDNVKIGTGRGVMSRGYVETNGVISLDNERRFVESVVRDRIVEDPFDRELQGKTHNQPISDHTNTDTVHIE
jgi:hypothetical protein